MRFSLFLTAVLIAPSADATCIPAKTFTNFNTIESPGAYYYIHWFDTAVTSDDIVARFWQSGTRAASNEGNYDDADWLLDSSYYPGQDLWYLNGNLGHAGVVGCPVGSLTVVANNTRTGGWLMATIDETRPRSVSFDYSRLATDFDGFEQRLNITATSRAGGEVFATLFVPDPTGAVYGGGASVTSIGVYSIFADRGSTPSRDVSSGWMLEASVPGAGGFVDVAVVCSDSVKNQYLAMGIEADGVAPTHVGIPREIECSPNLAEPKFKLVPRHDPPKSRK
jgi:hypothetical protein